MLGVLYKELTFKGFFEVLKDASLQTGAIMFIVAAAQIFAWIVTTERVAVVVYDLVIHFVTQKWAVLLIVNIVLLAIGCLIRGSPPS